MAIVRKLLGGRKVRARYDDISDRTLRRWELAKVIPPPDLIIRKRKYWYEDTLDKHDRRCVTERASAA
jgi:hypothetical protein